MLSVQPPLQIEIPIKTDPSRYLAIVKVTRYSFSGIRAKLFYRVALREYRVADCPS